jgi:membrane-associated phospholipid phosphatase
MQPHWSGEFRRRLRGGATLTITGITVLTAVFFAGYFFVQQHAARPPVVVPLSVVDMWIPFNAPALLAYVSLWVYIGCGPGLQPTRAATRAYGLWLSLMCLAGLFIFYMWPTQTPAIQLPPTQFPGVALLHRIDRTSNACPSMHVAVAVFTAIRVWEVLQQMRTPVWLHAINIVWVLLIVYSTLAVKQHVLWDVLAGTLLGLIFVALSMRWRPATSP